MKKRDAKEAAKKLAGMGRGSDTLLAHITPDEAATLKSMGGAGSRNPKTGLLEFFDSGGDGDGGDGDGGMGGGSDNSNGGLGSGADGLGSAIGGISRGGWGGGPGSQGETGIGGERSLGGIAGYGVDSMGNITGPAGFDSPGYGYGSTPSGLAMGRTGSGPMGMNMGSLPGSRTPGGILSGGYLNGWGPAVTLAGALVPGLAPVAGIISAGNMALGAYNSSEIGPNTGELESPSDFIGRFAPETTAKVNSYADAVKDSISNGLAGAKDTLTGGINSLAEDSGIKGLADKISGPLSGPSFANGGLAMSGNGASGAQRDPGILAAITGVPKAAFEAQQRVSPYSASRITPELDQGLLQQRLWRS